MEKTQCNKLVEMEGGECCIMIGIVVWLVGFEWFWVLSSGAAKMGAVCQHVSSQAWRVSWTGALSVRDHLWFDFSNDYYCAQLLCDSFIFRFQFQLQWCKCVNRTLMRTTSFRISSSRWWLCIHEPWISRCACRASTWLLFLQQKALRQLVVGRLVAKSILRTPCELNHQLAVCTNYSDYSLANVLR